MDINAAYVPTIMYGRFSHAWMEGQHQEEDENEDVLSHLHGNPLGSGTSTIPYIYCLSQKELKRNLAQLYNLKLTMHWPRSSKIYDETCGGPNQPRTKASYEQYILRGYVGVYRKFEDTKRYIIFHPREHVIQIVNTDSDRIVYENSALKDSDIGIPSVDLQKVTDFFYSPKHHTEQMEVNELMMQNISARYIDLQTDYFDVAEIARRRDVPVQTVLRSLTRLLKRITVNKVSGCWMSSKKGDYMKTFWMAKGGLTFRHLFHLPQELAGGDPTVIKNRHILHATICELTLGRQHFKCCRPQHLKLGTSRENSVHIKVRKSIDQIFDLSYQEMHLLSFYIQKLSEIIQRQEHIMTPDELKIFQRRKGNKIIECEDIISGRKWTTICGDPDFGDPHNETEETAMNNHEGNDESPDDESIHSPEFDHLMSDDEEDNNGDGQLSPDSTIKVEERNQKSKQYDDVDSIMFKKEEKMRKLYARQLDT